VGQPCTEVPDLNDHRLPSCKERRALPRANICSARSLSFGEGMPRFDLSRGRKAAHVRRTTRWCSPYMLIRSLAVAFLQMHPGQRASMAPKRLVQHSGRFENKAVQERRPLASVSYQIRSDQGFQAAGPQASAYQENHPVRPPKQLITRARPSMQAVTRFIFMDNHWTGSFTIKMSRLSNLALKPTSWAVPRRGETLETHVLTFLCVCNADVQPIEQHGTMLTVTTRRQPLIWRFVTARIDMAICDIRPLFCKDTSCLAWSKDNVDSCTIPNPTVQLTRELVSSFHHGGPLHSLELVYRQNQHDATVLRRLRSVGANTA
jgi:hypothetical protein